MATGDFDRDRRVDFAVANDEVDYLSVFLNEGWISQQDCCQRFCWEAMMLSQPRRRSADHPLRATRHALAAIHAARGYRKLRHGRLRARSPTGSTLRSAVGLPSRRQGHTFHAAKAPIALKTHLDYIFALPSDRPPKYADIPGETTVKRDRPAPVTILLTMYSLSQHGTYVKRVATFEGTRIDPAVSHLELPLCLIETPHGIELSIDPPELPGEPGDDPPKDRKPVVATAREEVSLKVSRLVLPAAPPALPESPTAKERWRYLLEVLKRC